MNDKPLKVDYINRGTTFLRINDDFSKVVVVDQNDRAIWSGSLIEFGANLRASAYDWEQK